MHKTNELELRNREFCWMRIVWTEEMDRRLGDWLVEKYGARTPDPDIVTWREAEALFEGAKSS